jgi:hypothetical protein
MVVALLEVLQQHVSGGTKKNHVIRHSGFPVSRPEFELGASRIRVKIVAETPSRLVSALLSGLRINRVQSQEIT